MGQTILGVLQPDAPEGARLVPQEDGSTEFTLEIMPPPRQGKISDDEDDENDDMEEGCVLVDGYSIEIIHVVSGVTNVHTQDVGTGGLQPQSVKIGKLDCGHYEIRVSALNLVGPSTPHVFTYDVA